MAAPSNAYLFNGARMPLHIEGQIKIDNYIALLLAEYGNQVKQLFFLDGMLRLTDVNGNTGFVGIVKDSGFSQGYTPYKMHAPARFSKGRLQLDGLTYFILNDAGLNTYAQVYAEENNNSFNNVIVTITLQQSYYNTTTDYYVQWRVNRNNVWSDWLVVRATNTPALAPRTTSFVNISIGTVGESRGMEVQVRPYITNEEGTQAGELISLITTLKRVYMKRFDNRADAAHYSGPLDYYYINAPVLVTQQTVIYKTGNGTQSTTNQADDGWYARTPNNDGLNGDASHWYYISDGKVATEGTGDGIIVNPPSTYFLWANYDTSAALACSLSGGANASQRGTYQKDSNGTHYADAACTILAADGTYTNLVAGTNRYYRIAMSGGRLAANGYYCSNGAVAPIN